MEKSKVIQFEKNDKDNGKEQARQILKNGILDMSVERLIQMVNFGLCGNVEIMTGLCGTSHYLIAWNMSRQRMRKSAILSIITLKNRKILLHLQQSA